MARRHSALRSQPRCQQRMQLLCRAGGSRHLPVNVQRILCPWASSPASTAPPLPWPSTLSLLRTLPFLRCLCRHQGPREGRRAPADRAQDGGSPAQADRRSGLRVTPHGLSANIKGSGRAGRAVDRHATSRQPTSKQNGALCENLMKQLASHAPRYAVNLMQRPRMSVPHTNALSPSGSIP